MKQQCQYELISHHLCPYVQRAIIVFQEKAIAHKRTYVDLANKPDWFTEISPLGRTPVLRARNAIVFESQVIVEYLDEITPGSLHSEDPLTKARDRSWIEFGSETLNAIAGFYSAKSPLDFTERLRVLKQKMKRIECEVAGQFFGGEEFRLIDGVWATVFRYFDVFDTIDDFEVFSGLTRVQDWREVLRTRPSVIGAVNVDYPDRLREFLRTRKSHLSTLIT